MHMLYMCINVSLCICMCLRLCVCIDVCECVCIPIYHADYESKPLPTLPVCWAFVFLFAYL